MIRVKDEPDLIRTSKGTIQNVNADEYRAFVLQRKAVLDTNNRIKQLESQNEELNDKLDLILQLLKANK